MNFFNDLSFAQPLFLWLLLIIPAFIAHYIFNNQHGEMRISSLSNFSGITRSYKEILLPLLFSTKMIALALLIIALARPQSKTSWKNITTEGIDIILSMDISASMLAKDLKPNRLEAA
jgi:Ca-activated chloride channel family protein